MCVEGGEGFSDTSGSPPFMAGYGYRLCSFGGHAVRSIFLLTDHDLSRDALTDHDVSRDAQTYYFIDTIVGN